MKKEKSKNELKRSLILKWSLSYFAIFIIPFILFIIFALTSSFLLLRSVKNSTMISLDASKRLIDLSIEESNSLAEDVRLDTQIMDVILSDDPSELDGFTLYEATVSLRHLIKGYKFLLETAVYNPERNSYVSLSGWGRLEELAESSFFNLPLSTEEKMEILTSPRSQMDAYDASLVLYTGVRVPRLMLIRPLTYANTLPGSGSYIVTVINLQAVLKDILSDYHGFLVFSKDGRLLFDSSGEIEKGYVVESIKDIRDGDMESVDGKFITFLSSDISSFWFALISDKVMFNRYLVLVTVMGVAFFLLSVLTTVFMVIRRIRKEWKAYEEAISSVGEEDRDKAQISTYEPFVQNAKRLREKEDMLANVVKAQTESIKERTLFDLVALSDTTVSREALSECGISFRGNDFLVLLIAMEDKERDSDEIARRVQEAFEGESISVYTFSSNYGVAFVLSFSLDDFKSDSYVYRLVAKKMTEIIESDGSIKRAASSDISQGLESLGPDYLDAINVIEYENASNIREFLVHRDVVGTLGKTGFSYTTEDDIRLQEEIERGHSKEASELFERIVERNREKGCSGRSMRYLLFSVMNTIINTTNRLVKTYGWNLPRLVLSPIIQADTFQKSYDGVLNALVKETDAISEILKEDVKDSERAYLAYKGALRIVQEEFKNPSVNVQYIADRLSVSLTFLSRSFKKYHGKNISDYLAEYRIMESKMMLSSGMKIEDIVASCGFGSTRTYLRLFKKYENVTPSQFKAMRREEKSE